PRRGGGVRRNQPLRVRKPAGPHGDARPCSSWMSARRSVELARLRAGLQRPGGGRAGDQRGPRSAGGRPFLVDDLIDRLCELADTAPDRVLYIELLKGTDETARLTAAQLRDRTAALAASLTAKGVA